MKLDDTQTQTVTRWITEGRKLPEIQTLLGSELGLRLTYMETRLLVDDLKLTPKDVETPKRVELVPAPSAAPNSPTADAFDSAETPDVPASAAPATGTGNVSVTVDKIAAPGALVSGSVTFSDGKSAQWYLDEMGRLGLAAKEKGYRPAPADVQAFQTELQGTLQKMGLG